MPKRIDDDPASAMGREAKALSKERELRPLFDQIMAAEKQRDEASDNIRKLWQVVKQKGHDVEDARRKYVRHVISRKP